MNNLSLKDAGCLTVAVSMQIARSGVQTPLGEDFSPATLVQNYRQYLYAGNDNWVWNGITRVIPNFYHDGRYDKDGLARLSDTAQANFLANGIENNCFYVVEVKQYRSGQHWVAIDRVENGVIYIMDPASDCKVLNECRAKQGFNYRMNTARCYRVR